MVSGSVQQRSRRATRPRILVKQEEAVVEEHKRGPIRADRH
jgi:hypothetical protein